MFPQVVWTLKHTAEKHRSFKQLRAKNVGYRSDPIEFYMPSAYLIREEQIKLKHNKCDYHRGSTQTKKLIRKRILKLHNQVNKRIERGGDKSCTVAYPN